ncbi:hypothetical protein [Dictyobacter arantiisoli]|uniref:Uncharacterized protein n=1 Tax=Dictyobacter arantiisoli TaxID=2014874 RepID=A0A5A5TJ20_9CHLR|nr:hypothetical protein [Dictyobacter arantiisoli]GCF11218.1 hypothetical protein KDI_47820 [Dictyobacter arantiisoli]
MPTIGIDCEIILDGTGYFVKPGSYQLQQPRIRKAMVRADGSESYVDLGPGKRFWSMVILCFNELTRYDGTATGLTGQQYRDALRASYLGSTGGTILFSDPLNTSIAVHFDAYRERLLDLHSQIIALVAGQALAASYEVTLDLLEA